MYPVLDGKFDKFTTCRNGVPTPRISTCPSGTVFNFGWQSCIARRFMVAFNERE
jgi:hypothetical protein